MNELLFVGGPLDGQRRAVPNGARSFVCPLLTGVWLKPALDADFRLPPEAVVPCQEGVYKRVSLRYASPGFRADAEVMAYFGRSAEDRPKGFHV